MDFLISLRKFQSTPSAWRETTDHLQRNYGQDFNPLPPHGGRRSRIWRSSRKCNFNPLPPHGGRLIHVHNFCGRMDFNPLPPHGGRHGFMVYGDFCLYFNPLPPHGGRHGQSQKNTPTFNISIHSLRMEGDISTSIIAPNIGNFNPLPPHGGRPSTSLVQREKLRNFNPLPPHGGRPNFSFRDDLVSKKFQSTPSAWRETDS